MRRRSAALAAALAASVVLAEGGRAQQTREVPASRWPYVQGRGVCFTQTGWCPINGNLPAGAACYCTIPPSTQIYGTVSPLEYRGHVSPFFNLHPAPVPGTIR